MDDSRTQPPQGAQAGERDWYTVQEAADYLQVSQPTIFRWMKQGLLSFYKVGGATRFSKEGLDAVIEKTTGLKEAEAAAGRCARCGHSILVDGSLQGTGKLYFRPAKSRFWVLAEALVPTTAVVCAACGYLQLSVDTAKLKRVSVGAAEPQEKGGEKPK
ncbi:MAG: helix-turn-helix domain-containing protein [Verrucomicrobiota bacterium]